MLDDSDNLVLSQYLQEKNAEEKKDLNREKIMQEKEREIMTIEEMKKLVQKHAALE